MDFLNLTNRVKIYEFFKIIALKLDDLLGGWRLATNAKFQHNISKITPARPKNTGTWDVNAKIVTTHPPNFKEV